MNIANLIAAINTTSNKVVGRTSLRSESGTTKGAVGSILQAARKEASRILRDNPSNQEPAQSHDTKPPGTIYDTGVIEYYQ